MQDAYFHVGWEQLHALPLITLNSSYQQIDNVFTEDEIHTLANVVIANPTHVDLFLQSCITQRFATLDMTEAKERSYCSWPRIDQFLVVAIEIFECLYK
jgi:hypothetical protein